MRPSAPCKDCTKRYVGCHSECPLYIKYKEENLEYGKAIAKARYENKTLIELQWLAYREYHKIK